MENQIDKLPDTTVAKKNPLLEELKEIFSPLQKLDSEKVQVFVHGSWADDSRTPFSDLDDLVIVDDDYIDFAKPALEEIEMKFQRIDPLQHHGHWIIKASQLNDFDQSFLPLIVLRDSLHLFGEKEVQVKTNHAKTRKGTINRIFQTISNIESLYNAYRTDTLSIYHLKRLVGSFLLIPPMLFQLKGEWIGKREAILKVDELFSPKAIECIAWAGSLRNEWGKLIEDDDYKRFISTNLNLFAVADEWRQFLQENSPVSLSLKKEFTVLEESVISAFLNETRDLLDRYTIREFDAEDYDTGYNRMKEIAIANKALIVGRFGKTRHPGISDLDVFICFDDSDYAEGCETVWTFIEHDENLSYFFTHAPLFVSKSSLHSIKYLHTLYGLLIEWNKKNIIFFHDLSSEYMSFLDLLWSYTITRSLLNFVSDGQYIKNTDLRKLLLLLKNAHTARENLEKIFNQPLSNSLSKSENIRNRVFREESGIRSVVTEELKSTTSAILRLIEKESLKTKSISGFLLITQKLYCKPGSFFEKIHRYGVEIVYLPVVYFNLLFNVINGRKAGKIFRMATRTIIKNHKKTGGYINEYILPFPVSALEQPAKRKYLEMKYLVKQSIKGVLKRDKI